MKSTITLLLENLGLSDKEAAVYSALLGVKRGTAQSVAEVSGVKRPTAYLVLEELKKKKLVAVTRFRGVKDYRAMPLENLKHFVREQKRQADANLSIIQKLYNKRKNKVRVRVYHTISDVKMLFEKSLREEAALHFFGLPNILESGLGDYWQFYLKRAQQLGINPKFKENRCEVMLLLWSDKVAFISFGEQLQVFGFKNKQLHDLYQSLWNNY